MLNKLEKIIDDKNLISNEDKIVVAVSGGPDSIALLYGLNHLKKKYNLELFVCHLNHLLRGEASDGDAKYVEEVSDQLGIESFIYSRDITSYAKERKLGFEEAAREVRYQLFDEVLEKTGANKIAVAQNMNDQAETVLMRIFRGTGLEGLTAIKFTRGHIIRPLLGIDRETIEKFCDEMGIKPRIDHTNFENVYTRNKVRLDVIPLIKEAFNENIIERLYEMSQLLLNDLTFIESEVEKAAGIISFGEITKVNLDDLNQLHDAIKSRLIRRMVDYFIPQMKGVTQKHIVSIQKLCDEKKQGKHFIISDEVKFEISYDQLIVYRMQVTEPYEMSYFIGDELVIGDHTFKSCDKSSSDRNSITIDLDKIKGQLKLRTRRAGDRFYPLGMKGSKKLSDYFINQKIPSLKRDHILLLCDDEHIIWIVGYRMSEKYKIDHSTQNTVTFKYEITQKYD